MCDCCTSRAREAAPLRRALTSTMRPVSQPSRRCVVNGRLRSAPTTQLTADADPCYRVPRLPPPLLYPSPCAALQALAMQSMMAMRQQALDVTAYSAGHRPSALIATGSVRALVQR
jgi:hypothetical protein